jgi:hypothetical protein
MAAIENPGALAGATGAGAFHATGALTIAQGEALRHPGGEGKGGGHD